MTSLSQVIPIIVPLIFFILIIILIIFAFRFVRRLEKRAEERLRLDQENAAFQKNQTEAINELNERLTKIENMLKEVE